MARSRVDLPEPDLPSEGENLALVQAERDVVEDGEGGTTGGGRGHEEVVDLDDRGADGGRGGESGGHGGAS